MKKKILITLFLISSTLLATVSFASGSQYDSARGGDLESLRQYRFEGIDLYIPDERGFIPYELAALHADSRDLEGLRTRVEIMLWLKEYKPKKHKYTPASIKLVQAGLKALDFNLGSADGVMGKKTSTAIKEFQKEHDLAETGVLGPQWLGVFYRELMKDIQFKLTKIGYNTGGTDGIMGKKTRLAMLNYRKDKQLSNPKYRYLDALLVLSLNNSYIKKEKTRKSKLAKKQLQKKQSNAMYLQAGLRTLGYTVGNVDGKIGSRTANALKSFQKKYKLKQTGTIDNPTKRKMDYAFLKESQRKLSSLGYKVGTPDGRIGKKTITAMSKFAKANNISNSKLTSQMILTIDNKFDNKVRITKKVKARKAATRKSNKKSVATKRANKKPVSKNITKISKSKVKNKKNKSTKAVSSVGSRRVKGKMVFNRKGGRVVGCSISSRRIPIEWCEPFYPLPRNNHCEASFKSKGAVINLWCK